MTDTRHLALVGDIQVPADMAAAIDEVPAWFWNDLMDGLRRLLLLSLERSPAADTLPGVALVWADAIALMEGRLHGITLDRERDRTRVRQAFRRLASEATRWPSPRQFVDLMEPRPAERTAPMAAPQALSAPSWDPAPWPAYCITVQVARLKARMAMEEATDRAARAQRRTEALREANEFCRSVETGQPHSDRNDK